MTLQVILEENEYEVNSDLAEGSFAEARRYALSWTEDRVGAALKDYRLLISGLTIEPCLFQMNNESVQINWKWEPEFFSGQFFPELYYQGQKIWPEGKKQGITVDPDAAKLSREEFGLMMEDIARIAQVAFSLSPAYNKTGLGKEGQKFSLAQMELLTQYIDKILLAVENIAKNPKKRLESIRRDVPMHQARQVDEAALLRLLSNPTGLIKSEHIPESLKHLANKTNGHLFETVTEVRKIISFDTYETRFVKGFLIRLQRLAMLLERQLRSTIAVSQQDMIRKSVAETRLEQIKGQKRKIQACLRLPFLEEVEGLDKVEQATVTMSKHSDYRRLYQYYRKFLLGIMPLGQESLEVSLERTYQLYEYWCFLKVVGYLLSKHGRDEADVSGLVNVCTESGGLTLGLKQGAQSVVQIDKGLKVYFQKTYSYYDESRTGSYSHEMRPDIVIERTDEAGEGKNDYLRP